MPIPLVASDCKRAYKVVAEELDNSAKTQLRLGFGGIPLIPALRILMTLLLLLGLAFPKAPAAQVVDKVVAQVNGEMITLFDLNEKVKAYVTQVEKKPFSLNDPRVKELQQRVLDSMIDDILLRQEAKRMKVTVSDTELESRIKEIRAKAGLTDEQFNQQLRLEGLTRKEFNESLRKDMLKKQLLGYMVQRKVVVTEDDIKEFYEAHKGELHAEQGGQHIGLIMLNKMDEAKALRQRIAGGQITFADAAKKHSVGPGAEQGGDLGKVSFKDLAPDLQKALTGLTPGQVSEPVLLDGKPVLLTLGAETSAAPAAKSTPELDSVRAEIQERLVMSRTEKNFTEYLNKLKAKSVIKINL